MSTKQIRDDKRTYVRTPRALCAVCHRDCAITMDVIRPHGPVKRRCPGSYQPPSDHVMPPEEVSMFTLDKPLTLHQRRHAIAAYMRAFPHNTVTYSMLDALNEALDALDP